jgi:hypothetical protein
LFNASDKLTTIHDVDEKSLCELMYDIGKKEAKKVMRGVLPASEDNEQNTQAPNKLNTPFRLSDADMEIRGISSTRQMKN